MRRHAMEQVEVVISSSQAFYNNSSKRSIKKRFKADLVQMFAGALIALFLLSIIWTVRLQDLERKQRGGSDDPLDGLVPNTNTKFLKSTPPELFTVIPKDDFATNDEDDDEDDEQNVKQEMDEATVDEYQRNYEQKAKPESRMNREQREKVIEELFDKAVVEDEKKHDEQVFESLLAKKEVEVEEGVKEEDTSSRHTRTVDNGTINGQHAVAVKIEAPPPPKIARKRLEQRTKEEIEEEKEFDDVVVEDTISNDSTKSSVAEKARKHKSLHATTLKYLAALAKTPTVLSLDRKETSRGKITCGGTEAVVFKTWHNFFTANENITRTLPPVEPRITEVVNHAQRYCRRRGECDFTKIYANAKLKNDEKNSANKKHINDEILPTCAVVGNAGSLRNAKFGEEIDAHDIVLRFNNGRSKHFEKQVGTKSHLRMYNGPYVEGKQGGEVTIAQLRDSSLNHWIRQYEKHRETFPESYIMDPEIICRAWDLVNREGEKPSSGMVGITFAMRLCSSVDIYGFSAESYFNETERPHYYDWERPKPGRENVHPFETERKLYKALQKEGLITLHETAAVNDENDENSNSDNSHDEN